MKVMEKDKEMSRMSEFVFVSILVVSALACGLTSAPLSKTRNLALTAEAMATSRPIQSIEGMPSGAQNLASTAQAVATSGLMQTLEASQSTMPE